MTTERPDIVVLGSGFGGSLLSTLLAKSGLRVVLIDRAKHPRFAIGESSTPLADRTLCAIADEFNLPELKPLSQYGSWKKQHPELRCGLKRGFSYFGNSPGRPLANDQILMVSASNSDQFSDTHWLRSDVDQFFFRLAQSYGVETFENAIFELRPTDRDWLVALKGSGAALSLSTPFVIDATGRSGEVLKTLRIPDTTRRLKTHSSAVFAHFENVETLAQLLCEQKISQAAHPFPCDAAAVHHVLDNGWMWQLRFDDDTVSAGFAFRNSVPRDKNAQEIWDTQIRRFPTLLRQFRNAGVVRPSQGLAVSPRLQYMHARAAGHNWAALPSTVGFIDPLHSTGIAHTLFAVRRLARILTNKANSESRNAQLTRYSEAVISEIHFIDSLVEGCYAALPSFRLWSNWCMLYFAAVTSMEQQASPDDSISFLRCSDTEFRHLISTARRRLATVDSESAMDAFEHWQKHAISPWNSVGLLDDSVQGMYRSTAAPDPN